jgi:hypothetical protein
MKSFEKYRGNKEFFEKFEEIDKNGAIFKNLGEN